MKQWWLDVRERPAKERIQWHKLAREWGATVITETPWDDVDCVRIDGRKQIRNQTIIGKFITIRNGRDQERAMQQAGVAVVACKDWAIIPWENLVATRSDPTIAWIDQLQDVAPALTALEHGVSGICFHGSPHDAKEAHKLVAKAASKQAKAADSQWQLETVKITQLQPVGMAQRVCIDATTPFADDEGLFVGSNCRSLAWIAAETMENEFVPARRFRVNAGALHQYVRGVNHTPYLDELRAGQQLLAMSNNGTRTITIGRCKQELRPHVLVHWGGGSAILQQAETVRLMTPGKPTPVTKLHVGDEISVWTHHAARHTGKPINAQLVEQ